jgi:hypothetical protein
MALPVALLIIWLFTGCDPVQEPWVQHPGQWQNERARNPQIDTQLRHRLAHTQIDR